MSDLFEHLAGFTMLTQPGTGTGTMFGHRTLTVGSKAFCVELDQDVVYKLAGEDHAEALEREGSHLFDPSGRGRPMREWVQVRAEGMRDEHELLALAACEYVRTLLDA